MIETVLLWLHAIALIFWLTQIISQALLVPKLRPIKWLWIGTNLIGVIAAYLLTVGTVMLLTNWLDVLQNVQHSMIVLALAVLAFAGLVTLSQWLVLRQRIVLPLLWAIANLATAFLGWWILLIVRFGLGGSVGLAILMGVIAGVAISKLLPRISDYFHGTGDRLSR